MYILTLALAFDTVEICVMLEQLALVSIRGECWRLIKNWHKNLHTQVSWKPSIMNPTMICHVTLPV